MTVVKITYRKEREAMALNMLREKEDVNVVARETDLPPQKIQELKVHLLNKKQRIVDELKEVGKLEGVFPYNCVNSFRASPQAYREI